MAKSMMDQDMLKVLYSEEQIRTRVREMGDTLYEQFKDRNPLFLGVPTAASPTPARSPPSTARAAR